MSPHDPHDVHGPYVRELFEARDWPGLVRYWMAHQYEPALDGAIALVEDTAIRGEGRTQGLPGFLLAVCHRLHLFDAQRKRARLLADFLLEVRQEPIAFDRELPEGLAAGGSQAETETLILLGLYSQGALCELAARFPPEQQHRALLTGVKAAIDGYRIAKLLEDRAAAAFFKSVMGHGLGRAGHLEQARGSFEEALTIRRQLARTRPDVYQPNVAMTLDSLGNALRDLKMLEEARAAFAEALAVRRQLAQARPDVAMTLHNLGNVLRQLNALKEARAAFAEALALHRQLAQARPDVYRPSVAMTLDGLGNVLGDLNAMEEARAAYEEATQLYEQAAGRNPTAHLGERLRCWANLGRLRLRKAPDLGRPERYAARDAFRQARACAEDFRGRFLNPAQKQRVQTEALHVYDWLVRTCVEIWEVHRNTEALTEAVEVAEASRARNLMELLNDETLQPANAPPDCVEEFRALRRKLRQVERLLRDEESRSPDVATPPRSTQPRPATEASRTTSATRDVDTLVALDQRRQSPERLEFLRGEVSHLRQEHEQALRHIEQTYDAEFDPGQPVRPINLDTIRTLLPADEPTAVVQYCLTQQGGIALIITREAVEAVHLPDLNDRAALQLAENWFQAYYACRGQRDYGDRWGEALPGLLEPAAERAVRPVVAALEGRGIRRLILSPNRALHVFPLHACKLADGRHLADAFEVVYTPSLSILHRCAGRRRADHGRTLIVENPTRDLAFTEVECASLRQLHPGFSALWGRDATRERLLREAAGCRVLHYSGHARFDINDPLRSALILGDKNAPEQWLTLRDIFCALHLRENVLTVVNGCESGMLRPDSVDEYVGLPSGLLYAGATCVVSTLWVVHDLSSALLADRFHREWLGGRGIAAALREAQRWLRDDVRTGPQLRDEVLPEFLARVGDDDLKETCRRTAKELAVRYPDSPPFASPVYWAAFTATGLGYPLGPRR